MIKELTVNEIMKNENIMLLANKWNNVIAPAGSGKTYYIFNSLLDHSKKSIYLCDTSNLKEAVMKDKDYKDVIRQEVTENTGFTMDKHNCIVMTYAKFFFEMNKIDFKEIDYLILDEVHNLFKYKDKFDSKEQQNYSKVIEKIESIAANILSCKVVGFTATHNRIQKLNSNVLSSWGSSIFNVINLEARTDIKRLIEDFNFSFNNYRNLAHYLKAFNGFKRGEKALIYTNRITECRDMIKICDSLGLKSIALWSKNNKENPMDLQQLEARKSIIQNGLIPEEYQVLIINGSYETGINISDESIQIAVINDSNGDTIIQARSRIRHKIKALIKKDINCIDDLRVVIPVEFLDRPLTTKDKRDLCKIVNVYGEKTSVLKWTSIKPIILNSGYSVIDGMITKKRIRVSTITDVDPTKRELIPRK